MSSTIYVLFLVEAGSTPGTFGYLRSLVRGDGELFSRCPLGVIGHKSASLLFC